MTIPSLAAGAQPLVFSLVVAVDDEAADGSTISESATIASATTFDPEDDNNHVDASTTVHRVTPEPTADLVVTHSASPANATVGTDVIVFTVTVTNTGPSPASHVTLNETLPSGVTFVSASGGISPTDGILTFTPGEMSVGAHVTYMITIRPQSTGKLTSTATVSAAEADPSTANNTAVASAVAVSPTTAIPPDSSGTPSPAPTSVGPRLIGVRRFGIHAMPTTVVLSFNKPLEPAARRPRNFRITAQKGERISIRSVVYDATANTLTLRPSERLSIHHPYKLIISDTGSHDPRDGSSRPLVGEVTAQPGSDYTIRLTWRQLVLPKWYHRTKAATPTRVHTVASSESGRA